MPGRLFVFTDSFAVVTTGKLVAKTTNGLTISGNASLSISGGNFQIGMGSSDPDLSLAISAIQNGGTVNLSGGGTFIVGSYFAANSISTGTYTQNAGTITLAPGSNLQFANIGGSGTFNLNGGLFSLPVALRWRQRLGQSESQWRHSSGRRFQCVVHRPERINHDWADGRDDRQRRQ